MSKQKTETTKAEAIPTKRKYHKKRPLTLAKKKKLVVKLQEQIKQLESEIESEEKAAEFDKVIKKYDKKQIAEALKKVYGSK